MEHIATNRYPTQAGARHTAARLRAGHLVPPITNILAFARTVHLEDEWVLGSAALAARVARNTSYGGPLAGLLVLRSVDG